MKRIRGKWRKEGNISFQKLIFTQMKRHWPVTLGMFLANTVLAMLYGAFTAEALRRIVQAVLDGSSKELQGALLFLAGTMAADFICWFIYQRGIFVEKKNITAFFEDGIYESYAGQSYWMNQDEAFGQIRKNVPDTVEGYIDTVNSAYQTTVTLITGCIYAGSINLSVLLAALIITLAFLLLSVRPISSLEALYRGIGEYKGKLYNRLWEQVRNREIAKFLIPERVMHPYEKESEGYLTALLRAKKISNATNAFASFGSMVMVILVAFIGGTAVVMGSMTYSSLLALVMVIPGVSSRLFWIPNVVATWRAGVGRSEPMMAFLRREERENEPVMKGDEQSLAGAWEEDLMRSGEKDFSEDMGSFPVGDLEMSSTDDAGEKIAQSQEKMSACLCEYRHISISDLVYAYCEDAPVLKGVTLELSPGLYAVAGRSGCGKTTFLKLVAKLLPCGEGEIWIDGVPLKEINRDDYWKGVSYAGQDPVILRESLKYNIAMEDDADIGRLERAAEDAQLVDFLSRQPDGFDTVVSPDSASKGECQKISIARVLYRQAKLILLDEITSALDPASEIAVIERLRERAREEGQIVLCISHRVKPLEIADRVLYFCDGILRGEGTHEELLRNEDYRQMVSEGAEG